MSILPLASTIICGCNDAPALPGMDFGLEKVLPPSVERLNKMPEALSSQAMSMLLFASTAIAGKEELVVVVFDKFCVTFRVTGTMTVLAPDAIKVMSAV